MRQKKKRNHKQDRAYTTDFKNKAIQLALRASSLDVLAKELDIPKPTLYTWVSNFKKGHVLTKKEESGAPTMDALQSNLVSLMDENRQLNKTITALLEEKSILKKAAAYFARELK